MPLYQPEKLADLIGFGFSFDFLQVYQFWNTRVDKNMMATTNTLKPKTKSLHQAFHV